MGLESGAKEPPDDRRGPLHRHFARDDLLDLCEVAPQHDEGNRGMRIRREFVGEGFWQNSDAGFRRHENRVTQRKFVGPTNRRKIKTSDFEHITR